VHELALADHLLRHVLHCAGTGGLTRVLRIELSVGRAQQVVAEALRTAFTVLSEDTIAAGAELVLVEEPLSARCEACGESFSPAIDDFTCPGCGRAAARLVGGTDVVLTSIEGEGEVDAECACEPRKETVQ